MQRDGWRQYNVLEAVEKLEALPKTEIPKVAALLDQPGGPPKKAVQMITKLVDMPSEARKAVLTLACSDDEAERRLALTQAALLPPPPDPGLVRLLEAERCLHDAARVTAPSHWCRLGRPHAWRLARLGFSRAGERRGGSPCDPPPWEGRVRRAQGRLTERRVSRHG
jgi:hypothetical protein